MKNVNEQVEAWIRKRFPTETDNEAEMRRLGCFYGFDLAIQILREDGPDSASYADWLESQKCRNKQCKNKRRQDVITELSKESK